MKILILILVSLLIIENFLVKKQMNAWKSYAEEVSEKYANASKALIESLKEFEHIIIETQELGKRRNQ